MARKPQPAQEAPADEALSAADMGAPAEAAGKPAAAPAASLEAEALKRIAEFQWAAMDRASPGAVAAAAMQKIARDAIAGR